MRLLIRCALLFAIGCAFAKSCHANGSGVPEAFATAREAAKVALSKALAVVDRNEYGGGILKCGDVYTYTAPQSSGQFDAFRVTLRIPKGCALAGIYHTHPATLDAERFSETDIRTAQQLRVPSFIATRGVKGIRVFDLTAPASAATRGRAAIY